MLSMSLLTWLHLFHHVHLLLLHSLHHMHLLLLDVLHLPHHSLARHLHWLLHGLLLHHGLFLHHGLLLLVLHSHLWLLVDSLLLHRLLLLIHRLLLHHSAAHLLLVSLLLAWLDLLPLLIRRELAPKLHGACLFAFVIDSHINNALRLIHNICDGKLPTSYMVISTYVLIENIDQSGGFSLLLKRERVTWPAWIFALTISSFGLLRLLSDLNNTIRVHFAEHFGVSSEECAYWGDY